MEKLFKVAQQFKESLRNYWAGRMQQSLKDLRIELEPWKVHPKLLEALEGLSRYRDPDGLWGEKTNRALYFFNLAVNYVKSHPDFKEDFKVTEHVLKGEIGPTGYVSNNELAKANTEKINLFRNVMSQIRPAG